MNDDVRKNARENLYDLQSEESFISHSCNNPKVLSDHHSAMECLTGERKELAKKIYEIASASEPMTEESLRLRGATEELRSLFGKLAIVTPQSSPDAVVLRLRDVAARREIASDAAAAFSLSTEGKEKAIVSIEAMEGASSRARLLLQGHLTSGGIRRVSEGLPDLINDIAWRAQNPGSIKGMAFGFRKLEQMLDGLQPSKFYLIGARPGVGKTALAGDIAVNLASAGIGGAFFSAEMSELQLNQRLLATLTGVNPTKSLSGALLRSELADLKVGLTKMKSWPLWIDDTDRIDIELLRSRARKAVSRDGAGYIIVDYIGLIRGVEAKSRLSKREEVGEVSGALKALSKELGVPVIALAQLRRTGNAYNSQSASTEIAKPNLESLKESGDLEQDADAVILLHRDPNHNIHEATAIVAKNRSGSTGEVELEFSTDTTSFKETIKRYTP